MKLGEIVGSVVSTQKLDFLKGKKLMVVKEIDIDGNEYSDFVAADTVGAGVGEYVLVVSGSSARRAFDNPESIIDSTIVGIIDSFQK